MKRLEDNPYNVILNTVRRDVAERSRSPIRLGTVLTAAPLTVQAGGLVLTAEDLLVNADLLGYTEPAVALGGLTGTLAVSASCSDGGSINSITVKPSALTAASLAHPARLAAGDRVVLLSEDDQTFLIICKCKAVTV